MATYNYHELLIGRGWFRSGRCNTCGGRLIYNYRKGTLPDALLKINAKAGTFRYSENGLLIATGQVNTLTYQHFAQ